MEPTPNIRVSTENFWVQAKQSDLYFPCLWLWVCRDHLVNLLDISTSTKDTSFPFPLDELSVSGNLNAKKIVNTSWATQKSRDQASKKAVEEDSIDWHAEGEDGESASD